MSKLGFHPLIVGALIRTQKTKPSTHTTQQSKFPSPDSRGADPDRMAENFRYSRKLEFPSPDSRGADPDMPSDDEIAEYYDRR